MPNYEIHVTGPKRWVTGINQELEPFGTGVPILGIHLLDSEGQANAGEDWMTAEKASFNSHQDAYSYLKKFLGISERSSAFNQTFYRRKIEVQYQEGMDLSKYLYVETHFPVTPEEAPNIGLPISRNILTGKLIATDRVYDPGQFQNFVDKYKDNKVELCLFDSNVRHDDHWIEVPKKFTSKPSILKYLQ